MVIAGCEVVVPVYVWETHAGGLGGELFAEAGGVASWEEGEGFEDDAMFGVLPAVGAGRGGEKRREILRCAPFAKSLRAGRMTARAMTTLGMTTHVRGGVGWTPARPRAN